MKKEIEKILKDITGKDAHVERSEDEHGDYSSNVAFSLAKEEKTSPVEIASKIKEQIDSGIFAKVEVKNGFLNFFLSDEVLKKGLTSVLREKEMYGKEKTDKVVVIDYSSPNIAKSFGVGHLRSTIIGQSLYNIYSFLGWETVGINHLGDWGTQYGKLLYQIKKEEKDPEKLTIDDLEKLYVKFHKEAEEDNSMEEEGRKWFSKLEKGDKEAREIWEICREKSIKEFDKIYKELDIEIDHVLGESFYEDKLQDVIKEAKEKGVAKKSKGAYIVEFEDMPPAMIEKSDQSTTYFTRDLSAVKYRLKEFSPDLFLYEIGVDQTLHMKQLFAAVEKLGWSEKEKFVHVGHGMFRLKDGKFSTRKGKTVHLEDVLSLAKQKALEMIDNSATDKSLTDKEREDIAKIVGVGAVKYNDLKRHHKRDVIFDWDQVLTLKGDSGPYLQYTCVRCNSILQKGGEYNPVLKEFTHKEKNIIKRIIHFKEVIALASETFSPNVIAEYAHRLAKDFNVFYDDSVILGDNQKMAVTEATYIVLKQCLYLLTLSVPDKM